MMRQFFVMDTAMGRYIAHWDNSREWHYMWGYTRLMRELPR